jgi:hypothetical protein
MGESQALYHVKEDQAADRLGEGKAKGMLKGGGEQ